MAAETRTDVQSWRMTYRELAEAWLKPVARIIKDAKGEALAKHLGERLVMCEGLDNDRACEVLAALLERLDRGLGAVVEGELRTAREADAELHTVYLDGRPPVDWAGIARIGEGWTFVLAGGLVLVPPPVEV
jgi:hypothetical protein